MDKKTIDTGNDAIDAAIVGLANSIKGLNETCKNTVDDKGKTSDDEETEVPNETNDKGQLLLKDGKVSPENNTSAAAADPVEGQDQNTANTDAMGGGRRKKRRKSRRKGRKSKKQQGGRKKKRRTNKRKSRKSRRRRRR